MSRSRKPSPMRLSTPRAVLKRLLDAAATVAPAAEIPILADVLLVAAGDRLHATATDMDVELQASALVEIASPGECAVPAKLFAQLVTKSAAEGVVLELDPENERLKVAIGRARATLPTLPTEDFPSWSGGDYSHSFTLSAGHLSRLLTRALYAASNEDARYYLQGVYLHAHDQSLRAVATDGHRLSVVSTLLPGGADGMPGIIIPTGVVKRVLKLFGDGDVEIEVAETRIRFSSDGPDGPLVLASKVIDGTFPDYQRIIPDGEGQIVEVARADLLAALRRATAFATEKAVKLTMVPELLTIQASTIDAAELAEDMDAAEWSGAPGEVGVNAAYLAEALDHLSGDRVAIVIADAASPLLVRSPADPDALAVVMPVRI